MSTGATHTLLSHSFFLARVSRYPFLADLYVTSYYHAVILSICCLYAMHPHMPLKYMPPSAYRVIADESCFQPLTLFFFCSDSTIEAVNRLGPPSF